MRLLLVEDNARLAEYIGEALRRNGFAIDTVATASEASAALRASNFDVVVLDLGLPDMDGMTWLNELRRQRDARPVLVLTARDKTEDVVKVLNLGADDYMRKPFEIDELVARIRALLRRPTSAINVSMSEGNLTIDTSSREVWIAGNLIDLGRRELNGLEVLMRRAGRVVAKPALEEAVYEMGEELSSNAVEVLVHRLRKHLREAGANISIHTLRGVGYMLSEDPK